ncbi:MAG TPA: hypothetical protein VGY53_04720, partial [Isosphaeraceae bacterium]|nr:hypothetical protein [Isosphaeraceae bacterium]
MPQRAVAKRIKEGFIPVAEPLEGRPLFSLGFASFAIPGANARVTSMTRGPDGNLWFTQVVGPTLFTQTRLEIGRLTPLGALTLFDVPSDKPVQSVSASGIVAGPGGKLYFTEEVTHINQRPDTGLESR